MRNYPQQEVFRAPTFLKAIASLEVMTILTHSPRNVFSNFTICNNLFHIWGKVICQVDLGKISGKYCANFVQILFKSCANLKQVSSKSQVIFLQLYDKSKAILGQILGKSPANTGQIRSNSGQILGKSQENLRKFSSKF